MAIAGVPDPTAEGFGFDGPDLAHALTGIPNEAFPRILLCHQPILTADAERRGVTLQLSGHTHGGQFFPWTLVASWVHRFNAGLHRLGALWIYVSRGTGYWGPPMRLLAPAEVTALFLAAGFEPIAVRRFVLPDKRYVDAGAAQAGAAGVPTWLNGGRLSRLSAEDRHTAAIHYLFRKPGKS